MNNVNLTSVWKGGMYCFTQIFFFYMNKIHLYVIYQLQWEHFILFIDIDFSVRYKSYVVKRLYMFSGFNIVQVRFCKGEVEQQERWL